MHFALSEDQQFLQKVTDEVVGEMLMATPARQAATDGGRLRSALWSKLAELDLVALLVPAEGGGSGGSLTDACVVAEVLGRHLAPVPYVGTAIAAASVLRFAGGSSEALSALAAGKPYAILLDQELTDAGPSANIAFDWVEDAQGVALSPSGVARTYDLRAGQALDDVDPLHRLRRFDPVPVGAPRGAGARRARAMTWAGAAALLTGLADGALTTATEYARQRHQYQRPIGSFQAVQHLCADMLVDVETARSVTYGASWAAEHASIDEAERVAAAAKVHAGAAAVRTCETSIQVLGGIGVTEEHDAHLRLRTAHLHHAAFGGADAPALLLAERILEGN